MVKKWLTLIISFTLSLVFADLILGYFNPPPQFQKIDISSTWGQYLLSPNRKLIYTPKPNTGLFNGYGERGKEFPFERTDKKRIVFMGDSVVEGCNTFAEDRFTELLNDKFKDRYEIINLGVCGYSFLQEVEYFKSLGCKFNPDEVVFGITFNDLRLYSGEMTLFDKNRTILDKKDWYSQYYSMRNKLDDVLLFSNIYRALKNLRMAKSKKSFYESIAYKLRKDEIDGLLKEMEALARERKFKLFFVFLPVNTEVYSDEIREFEGMIRSHGISCLNLNNYFLNDPMKNKMFYKNDPCHFNVLGERLVFYLIQKNWDKFEVDGTSTL